MTFSVIEDWDDRLDRFREQGAPSLPPADRSGFVENRGAKIWFSSHGAGRPVALLHGGLGHAGNWGHQVPFLVGHGYQVVVVDTRGHGLSTRDHTPNSYQLLASDVLAVLDELRIGRASLVGWSDGACTALVLADDHPERVERVLFFACNMDDSGTVERIEFGPVLQNCLQRHKLDYRALSFTPEDFEDFSKAVGEMQRTQPNYTRAQLERIRAPVLVLHAEHDEFIRPEHARYLARTLPNARLSILPGVSHFAPLQRPRTFNTVLLGFLGSGPGRESRPASV